MASIQQRTRRDGTPTWAVLYVVNKRQTSVTFTDADSAEKFRTLVNTVGARRAMDAWGIPVTTAADPAPTANLEKWFTDHVDQLTGVEQKTIDDYRRYIRRDIVPFFGDIPLAALESADLGRWVKHLQSIGNSPKTIRNKYRFVSGVLAKAVPTYLPVNPAAGRQLPRGTGDDHEIRMLTRAEYAALLEATTEPWRPLLEFMVASGARWGEVVALKPSDIDRVNGTVKIRRAWKYSSAGYAIGATKTVRSNRTIRVPARVLDQLDYSGEWLFTNRAGGPVRYQGFRRRVWDKAVERAQLDPPPTPHDLRHTCASWMLNGGVPSSVVSRHLGHESIKITHDIYGDVDQASAGLAADFMDGALSGAADTPSAGSPPAPHPTQSAG